MPDIFISHSTKDDAVVAAIRRALEGQGLSVWGDSRELAGGDPLEKEVREAIAGARHFLAVVSTAAMNSSWVRKEIGHALEVQRERSDGFKVIPVLLPPIEPAALGLWFAEEPGALRIEVGHGGIQAALPGLMAALGMRLPDGLKREDASILLHLLYYAPELESLIGTKGSSFAEGLEKALTFYEKKLWGRVGAEVDDLLGILVRSTKSKLLLRILAETREGGEPLPQRPSWIAGIYKGQVKLAPEELLGHLNEIRHAMMEAKSHESIPSLGQRGGAVSTDRKPRLKHGSIGQPTTGIDVLLGLPQTPIIKEAFGRRLIETPRKSTKHASESSERRISVWLGDPNEVWTEPLRRGVTYALHFKIGSPVQASMFRGPESEVPDSDVPDGGLETRWVVSSTAVELALAAGDGEAIRFELESKMAWQASFSLLIPRHGESSIRRLSVTPISDSEDASLDVLIYTHREIYRQFKLRFGVDQAVTGLPPLTPVHETVHTPLHHADLRPLHEWTTPTGTLAIAVLGDRASARGDIGGGQQVEDTMNWLGGDGQVAGCMDNVRDAAEKLRIRHETYLNAVDSADLLRRLGSFSPQYDWQALNFGSDPDHDSAWASVAVSSELSELAFYGYRLYDTFFPRGRSPLREWLDSLSPGHRIDLSWLRGSGPDWRSHVPWGLMYRNPPPRRGDPVDPMDFLGLRYRIAYSSRPQRGTKALGRLEDIHHAHLLYWGDDVPTGTESQWQRQLWEETGHPILLPSIPHTSDPKGELVDFFDLRPGFVSPMTVLYLFCNCSVGEGGKPVLRFSNTNQASALIRQPELGLTPFPDQPFVFANACTSAAADPYFANELAATFFDRGCRAFLGTETKVPIQLASRFAAAFFQFFFRQVDPQPISAGESVSQARLFLWTQYRNIGGLFYTYVNRFELFMASDAEVAALRV